ncbi:MAG: hypothetical protein ACLU45_01950 [Dialister invisus]|uniref:hypothetical protein n=1 Tax=Dialister invisus TaxID=218538 RepID=UPI00399A348F
MAKSEELRIKELNRYGDMITRGFRLLALLSDLREKVDYDRQVFYEYSLGENCAGT